MTETFAYSSPLMQKFPRRADVVRYLEYRRSVLSAYLDDMDRPEE